MKNTYYIRNVKTNKNYDTDFRHFYDDGFSIDFEKDKNILESLIKGDVEKFKNCIIKEKKCKHDFREFFKTRFGMLKLKEVKCIYCGKIKQNERD